MENKYIKIYIIIVTILLLIVFFRWQNNDLITSKINYKSNKLPQSFNNFKIIHISDLHNKKFGKNQSILINKINQQDPNIIVITGDLVDKRRYKLKPATEFIKEAIKLAPVYYVAGNHESYNNIYKEVKPNLEALGVTVLDNKKVSINKDDSIIDIIGLLDPEFYDDKEITLIKHLNSFANPDNFTILLSHRPSFLEEYSKTNIDLVFSGHAHGGQIRLPLIGGLLAPDQGLFPKYTSGLHTKDQTSMVVSRGLGNSLFPIRLFNKPEIVSITLESRD